MGLELAGVTAAFTLAGYWFDQRYGTQPWGILAGVVLGLTGGLYNLIRESLNAIHSAEPEQREASKESRGPAGPAE